MFRKILLFHEIHVVASTVFVEKFREGSKSFYSNSPFFSVSLSVFSFFEPITELIRSKAASVLTFCPPDQIFVVMLMIFLVVCTATAMVLQIFMQEALVMHKISMFSYFQINSKTSLFFKSFFIIFFPFTTRDKIVSINYSNKIKNFDTNVLCKSENRKKKESKM